jgi:hypothetical protein
MCSEIEKYFAMVKREPAASISVSVNESGTGVKISDLPMILRLLRSSGLVEGNG